jgi:DNA-binding MarR family transcriptional regulator
VIKCGVCGENNPESNKFCDRCGERLLRYSQTIRSRPVGSLNDFEAEVIWSIYCGRARVQDIAGNLRVRYETLVRSIDSLVNEGLLEREERFPYTRGSSYVHLTPDGYNQAAHLAKQRKEEYEAAPRSEPSPTSQPGPQPGGQQVTVTQRSGWEVCGYACVLLIVIFVALLILARGWLCMILPFIPGC